MKIQLIAVNWTKPASDGINTLLLPEMIARGAGLKGDSSYLLKIGTLTTNVTVRTTPQPIVPEFLSSRYLRAFCSLPEGTTLVLKINSDGSLRLGPLIGLLTVKLPDQPNPFGKQSKYLKALISRGSRIGSLIFAFSPEDISNSQGIIWGYVPLNCNVEKPTEEAPYEEDLWTRIPVPFPDLVYNRIPSRYWETQDSFTTTIELFKNMKIPVFNPGFLDKYAVQEKLSQMPEVKGYLPETLLYENPDDLAGFMNNHPKIFLKPCSGSLGRRIVRISKDDGLYSFKYRKSNGEIASGSYSTAQELTHALRFVMGSRPFMLQQAIPLAEYEGQEFDIRLMMQKDRFGQWRRTKTYVRIVQPGSLTANLSTGAAAKSIVEVVQAVFGERFEAPGGIGDSIRRGAEKVTHAIEKAFPGIWAEMGIDFGIDVNGRLWLIEVNSKPFRALESSIGMTQRIDRSFLRPLEFARFLLGFYPHSI